MPPYVVIRNGAEGPFFCPISFSTKGTYMSPELTIKEQLKTLDTLFDRYLQGGENWKDIFLNQVQERFGNSTTEDMKEMMELLIWGEEPKRIN